MSEDRPNKNDLLDFLSKGEAWQAIRGMDAPGLAAELDAAGFRRSEVPKPQGEPSDASDCEYCGGEAWHHTVECFTGTSAAQEAVTRLENCLANREAGIGAWSMVRPEDVRTVLAALRDAGVS